MFSYQAVRLHCLQLWTFPGQGGNIKDAALEKIKDRNMCELCIEFSKSSAMSWVRVAVPSLLVGMMVHAGTAG